MRKLAKWTAALLVGFVLVLGLWGDQAINPDVAATLQVPPRLPATENAHNLVINLAANSSGDPVVTAHDAVTQINALLADPHVSAQAITQMWLAPGKDTESLSAVSCDFSDPGCVTKLKADVAAVAQLGRTFSTLTERYHRIRTFPHYRSEIVPHVNAPIPRFSDLLGIHRLSLALRLTTPAGANTDRGGETPEIATGRFLLARAQTMLEKMVAVSMVVQGVHALHSEQAPLPILALLDEPERSFEAPMQGEFRFVATAIETVASDPATGAEMGIPTWMQSTVLLPMFKPNRTINYAYRCFQQLALAAPKMTCKPPWSEWILNPIGTALFGVAQPTFSTYSARLRDLEGLIMLSNLVATARNEGKGASAIGEFIAARGGEFRHPALDTLPQWDATTRSVHYPGKPSHETWFRLLVLD